MTAWHFTPATHAPAAPVDNAEDPLLVVPNERGGYSVTIQGSQSLVGNYPTSEEAETYARTQCKHVRVVPSQRVPATSTTDDLSKAISLIRSV